MYGVGGNNILYFPSNNNYQVPYINITKSFKIKVKIWVIIIKMSILSGI
jgi:hypothetical protein